MGIIKNRLCQWGFLVGFVVFGLWACTTTPLDERVKVRSNEALLTRDYAQFRSSVISEVRYDQFLDLPAENEPFTGQSAITFALQKPTKNLSLDFVGGEVSQLVINGQQADIQYDGVSIPLAFSLLRAGQNTVEVTYTHAYRRDGTGLHWFKDPKDGETYLFSQFEAWDFNQVFPGFDQPDLKAVFQLEVEVPSHWQVVTATREITTEEVGHGRARWRFAETERFSTYLQSLHAGPYQVWENPTDFRIPLRLFARQSYSEHVDTESWFEVTQQGFDFFESYFEYDFPFSKYDQVLVPEFKFGAMENVGAVTFTERLQPRRAHNAQDKQRMAVVVMHEMAHHWFGNLVTMRWWDDIWLNESFADLMGNYATAKVTEHKDAMTSFSTSRKSWGYEEDRWITTHPIVQDIPNTTLVMASIDGITYAKGAASLIQLMYLLGEDTFQQGLAHYFDTFAWRNTELEDFIGALGETANKDLGNWIVQWLQTSGTNGMLADFTCEGDRITAFDLNQLPANVSGAIREHALDMLFIMADGSRQKYDVSISKKRNPFAHLVGESCPVFVLANVSDHTFANSILDAPSLAYLQSHFGAFKNPIERGLIWRSLWESVLAGSFSVIDYLNFAETHLPMEGNASSLKTQFQNVMQSFEFLTAIAATRPELRDDLNHHWDLLESLSWQQYRSADETLRRQWFHLWLFVSHSDEHQQYALGLLNESKLGMDDLWSLAGMLVRVGHPKGVEWVNTLAKQDVSANAETNALIVQAMAPEKTTKQMWLSEAQNPNSDYAYTQLRGVWHDLFPVDQYDLQMSMRDAIMAPLRNRVASVSPNTLQAYAAAVIPIACSAAAQQTLLDLAGESGMPGIVVKTLKKRSQMEEQCKTIEKTLFRQRSQYK